VTAATPNDAPVPDGPDFGVRSDFYTFAPETLAQELPDFAILREVGKGSMGIVYEATERATGRRVALKVLPPSLTLTERALARFLREGEIMAKITHPAIVRVFDHGRQGRLHYFVMEFVDGTTLDERLRVGPLPVQRAAEIAAETARALQFAHDRGILHRDIKPGNLMLRDDGRVAITDFGLARETGTGSMTESGAIVGTPMYMAPEQVLGDRGAVGTRADVYGLGATLYQLVTGRPPFEGPTAQSVLKSLLEHDPPSPRRLRTDLPRDVEAIVCKAMEKAPMRRYGSAQEMAEDLERYLRGERVLARRPGPLQRITRTIARRPAHAALVLLLLVVGIGSLVIYRDSRLRQLESGLADAEGAIARAASMHDDRQRPRSIEERRDLLHSAIATASDVIQRDPTFARAWFVRAKAYHRLQQYQEALHDLDAAERTLGRPTPEVLHFRIDTLEQLRDTHAATRLRAELMRLLELDPSPFTRCLIAEHLFALHGRTPKEERAELRRTAAQLLADVGDDDEPRVAVARVRLLELEGRTSDAEIAMRRALGRFEGNPLVHSRAARLFRRLGLSAEGDREAQLARMLDPQFDASRAEGGEAETRLDADEVQGFLRELDGLVRGLGGRRPEPVPGASGKDPGSPRER
jgi:tetratricopeptide (TPR) repeat protein/predicted Ser/Thr protein kinase